MYYVIIIIIIHTSTTLVCHQTSSIGLAPLLRREADGADMYYVVIKCGWFMQQQQHSSSAPSPAWMDVHAAVHVHSEHSSTSSSPCITLSLLSVHQQQKCISKQTAGITEQWKTSEISKTMSWQVC